MSSTMPRITKDMISAPLSPEYANLIVGRRLFNQPMRRLATPTWRSFMKSLIDERLAMVYDPATLGDNDESSVPLGLLLLGLLLPHVSCAIPPLFPRKGTSVHLRNCNIARPPPPPCPAPPPPHAPYNNFDGNTAPAPPRPAALPNRLGDYQYAYTSRSRHILNFILFPRADLFWFLPTACPLPPAPSPPEPAGSPRILPSPAPPEPDWNTARMLAPYPLPPTLPNRLDHRAYGFPILPSPAPPEPDCTTMLTSPLPPTPSNRLDHRAYGFPILPCPAPPEPDWTTARMVSLFSLSLLPPCPHPCPSWTHWTSPTSDYCGDAVRLTIYNGNFPSQASGRDRDRPSRADRGIEPLEHADSRLPFDAASVMLTPCLSPAGPTGGGGTSCRPALRCDSIITPVMLQSPATSRTQIASTTLGWLW
ncbi:hypothetical protein FIBSPDRAFT_1038513 [Athelia psychrophila]|uniref:Uncharacterized protein n=1 Tax=Athelia psychrophila TaxID=1759441 RepID=A0A166T4E9_9AGAM|nr:hypothetical protein FIBSPDRAFT_1038513 [Fibularhizoctonia sp. CBS 109695]